MTRNAQDGLVIGGGGFGGGGFSAVGSAAGVAAGASQAATRPAAAAPIVVAPEWRGWIAENLLMGNTPDSIVSTMVSKGFALATASAEVEAARAHPYVAAAKKLGSSPAGIETVARFENKLKKRDWVLEIFRRSSRQASSFGAIPRVHKPSRQDFLDNYYSQNRPVVIEGAMDDWRAMTEWTGENLKRRFGDRVVEVQANRNSDASYEIDQQNFRQQMPFGEFVDITENAGQTNNWYMTASNSGRNKDTLRGLWDDVVLFPDYLKNDPANNGFFWFGPAGTVTPLHHDLTNNFMAQVRGRKLVRLIAPFELAHVYNHRHCFSQIDLDQPDLARFPDFKNVRVIDVEIGPGDLFFLPVGWWHYVRGLEISITMTFTNFVFDNDFYSFYSTYHAI